MWNLQFNSYQDVKNVLSKYAYFICIIISLIVYLLLLPDSQKNSLNTLFGNINSIGLLGLGISIVFGFVLSFMSIHFFEIHDKVYDKFIIKWRYRYAKNFLIPELYKPFDSKLDGNFYDLVKANMRDFMNVYYHFVGDYDVKIRKTAVVRFYDSVWKYWATQINEIFTIAFIITTIGYWVHYIDMSYPLTKIIVAVIAAIIFFVINRLLALYFLRFVKIATQEQIVEIHDNFISELEEKTRELSEKLSLSYG